VSREERLAANEALFREVNERISEISGDRKLDELEVLCECIDEGCNQRMSMSRGEYERLRQSPTQFAVVLGHEQPDVETVVAARSGYAIVNKIGVGAQVAEDSDPR
jgi:hypothetical protein